MTTQLFLPDELALEQLARVAAGTMPPVGTIPDKQPLVVFLEGDLGTGKTTFARAMLRAMGEPGPVRSPTYGLLAEYATPAGRALHLDLYRIRDPAELTQLGLSDYLPDSRIWLVEWPARAAGRLPGCDLRLCLAVKDAGRVVDLVPLTEPGRRWVAAISAGRIS